jgi:uncharacterized protein (TIGR02611 family)
MGLLGFISEKREELIERHAQPYMDEGEEVLHWVRCAKVGERGEGFIFLTPLRLVIFWTGKKDGHCSARWDEITTWGQANDVKGGPILGVEVDGDVWYAQVYASTRNMAGEARRFIQEFGALAPWPKHPFVGGEGLGTFQTEGDVEVDLVRKTPAEMAKRAAITFVGAALVIGAILVIPLPGPWSFLISIGGLAILSQEYDWAKDLLEWTKERFQMVKAKIAERKSSKAARG